MGWLRINPACREELRRQGLVAAADFLRLQGVILSGHPDRHVLRVDVGGLLKKEHRVPWRDRLANVWAGSGLVSKTTREANALASAARARIPCPQVLAHGTQGGQAFLLLREEPGMTDLCLYLQQYPGQRLLVGRALGRELARMHAAGFEHGDLYAKHVLVGPGPRFCFVDWQRARHRRTLSWARRCRDLATLDATLPASVASDRIRLACLRSYVSPSMRGGLITKLPALTRRGWLAWKAWVSRIRYVSLKLQKKPRIRALRHVPLPVGAQSVIWLDGEALCVTGHFRDELAGHIPDWLRFRCRPRSGVEQARIPLGPGRDGNLVRRTAQGIGRRLMSWWRGQPAREVQLAALLFRLERHRVPCPRLLAFGHRRPRPWSADSFLLTETPATQGPLFDLFEASLTVMKRGTWLRQAGVLLRRLHEAGYSLGNQAADFGAICAVQKEDQQQLILTRVDFLERKARPWLELALLDLPKLVTAYRLRGSERMRFFLGYLGTRHVSAEGRALSRRILSRTIFPRLAREVAR